MITVKVGEQYRNRSGHVLLVEGKFDYDPDFPFVVSGPDGLRYTVNGRGRFAIGSDHPGDLVVPAMMG